MLIPSIYKGINRESNGHPRREGGWCVSLGVPIGNQMNDTAWWTDKINEVRGKVANWGSLARVKFFGRNTLVQGLYFGRLRYWAYTLLQRR